MTEIGGSSIGAGAGGCRSGDRTAPDVSSVTASTILLSQAPFFRLASSDDTLFTQRGVRSLDEARMAARRAKLKNGASANHFIFCAGE